MSNKWATHAQPPTFYWTFKNIVQDLHSTDYRLRSSRFSTKSRIELAGEESIDVVDLLQDAPRTARILSKTCMMTFEGKVRDEGRTLARNLDYLAYGSIIRERGKEISDSIVRKVGDHQVGELIQAQLSEKEQSA